MEKYIVSTFKCYCFDCSGSTTKSLRLNCVKRLARSKNSHYKESAYQKDLKFPAEGFNYLPAGTS